MPELVDQMYCSQQIVIPPRYPYILKRYCKAAIKTQPYDLLRWSFEYFRALAENRPPPVKLRLEYPVFCSEGGLTRGCLRVLAHQLSGMKDIPLSVLKRSWSGFCLDNNELLRILCLCEVHCREESVNFLHFIAVAGGILTKCLTHTMILLCESLTKEPDGGSASIPCLDFLVMYKFLAKMDCSQNCVYIKGRREGVIEPPEEVYPEWVEEEQAKPSDADQEDAKSVTSKGSAGGSKVAQRKMDIASVSDKDDFWGDAELQKLKIIDDKVARSNRLSIKLNMPLNLYVDRSPSVERASKIERENFMMDRKSKPSSNQEIDMMLRKMSLSKGTPASNVARTHSPTVSEMSHAIRTQVEGDVPDPSSCELRPEEEHEESEHPEVQSTEDGSASMEEAQEDNESAEPLKFNGFVEQIERNKAKRIEDIKQTFADIAEIVDKYHSANYDLGMVAGRQMSSTSGEFIVQHIEREIMEYINEQIAILPDPDLKKKKAKPEEVQMIKDIISKYLDDHMSEIVVDVEDVEEEEEPIPDIVKVYAVPGIGPKVDEETIEMFEDYIRDTCKTQGDMVMPRNIRHFLCPPLEHYEEQVYDRHTKEE